MKRIIIVVFSLLFLCCFSSVNAEGFAFPIVKDDISKEIGNYCSGEFTVVLVSETNTNSCINQDSVAFAEIIPATGPNSTKTPITKEIVSTFFVDKPLPTGLEVTAIDIESPFMEDGLYEQYYGTQLRIHYAGTIPATFNVKGYENDFIQLTIPKDYLFNYFKDTPLTVNTAYTIGKYKLTCTKYDVSFDVQGHGTAPDDQKIQKGFKATKPDDPSESGWVFSGWYKEPECTNIYDFDTETVTSDITLYASWVEYVEPYVPPVIEPIEEPIFIIPNTGIE